MADAIKANRTYTVDFANTRFQVRTVQPNRAVPLLWECVSLFTGRELVIPERAFLMETMPRATASV